LCNLAQEEARAVEHADDPEDADLDFGFDIPGPAPVAADEAADDMECASNVSGEEAPMASLDPGDGPWAHLVADEEETAMASGPTEGVASGGDVVPPSPAGDGAPSASHTGAPSALALGRASAVVFVEGGKVAHYAGSSSMEATCNCPTHGKCRLTRTVNESSVVGREGQGRPVGQLVAWLAKGNSLPNKDAHMGIGNTLSFADRTAARATLAAMGTTDVTGLFAAERPSRAGESLEPVAN
jgi:hypothetical protein